MLIKEWPAQVKVAINEPDAVQGQFTALVSVFGNKDSTGDVVVPGAFTESLDEWRASGNPIPVIWSHDWADPFSHIGYVLDAAEKDRGLQVTAQLDMGNPKAAQVFNLLKSGRVTQFSFAYDVLESVFVEDAATEEEYTELRKLQLFEVGPTLIGANQATELLDVKAAALLAGLKEGRVLAGKHVEALRSAHATIGAVIAVAERATIDDEGKSGDGAVKSDEPDTPETSPSAPVDGGDATPDEGEAPARQDESRPETEDAAAVTTTAAAETKSGTARVNVMALELSILEMEGAA